MGTVERLSPRLEVLKMQEVGNIRLEELARVLDEADALHRQNGEPEYDQHSLYHICGTPACALGHAFVHFKDQGLNVCDPKAEEVFFGLGYNGVSTSKERRELFGGNGCGQAKTAKEAAAYIRGFVARRREAAARERASWAG